MELKDDLILFGASKLGEQAYNELHWDYNILYFCDNSLEKRNKNFCGCKVISIEELIKIKEINNIDIIITSMYWAEIGQQLELQGLKNIKVYNSTMNPYRKNINNSKTLFANTLIYNKNQNIKKCRKSSKVLFLLNEFDRLDENFYELIELVSKENLNIDVCVLNSVEKDRLFINDNINMIKIKSNKINEEFFNMYDIVYLYTDNEYIREIAYMSNSPIIEYISNGKYFKEGMFINEYIHELTNNLYDRDDLKNIYDYYIRSKTEVIDTKNYLMLPIRSNIVRDLGVSYPNAKIERKKLKYVLIIDCELLYSKYAIEKLEKFATKLLDITIYTNGEVPDKIKCNSRINVVSLNEFYGEIFMEEISKYNYAISVYSIVEDKFFISDIIDNNLHRYMQLDIPVIIDEAFDDEGFEQKYIKKRGIIKLNLDKNINKQLGNINVKLKTLKNSDLYCEFFENKLESFNKRVSCFLKNNINNKSEKKSIIVRIVTKNRCENLRKSISFYMTMKNIDIKLYIMDGSTDEFKKKNIMFIKSLNNKNIYHKLFENNVDVYERFYNSIEDEYKYIVTVADDDFITERSLITSIEFLENNNEFDCVIGNSIFHSKNYMNDFLLIKTDNKILEEDDPKIRTNNFYNRISEHKILENNIYSCIKKDVFNDIVRIISNKEFYEMKNVCREYFGYIITAYKARIKYLDDFLNIREDNNLPKKDYQQLLTDNKDDILQGNDINLKLFEKDILLMKKILNREKIDINIESIFKAIISSAFYKI